MDKLYIVLISVHGLIRGEELELGRDADTGGQVKYVVELAKALAKDERVEKVELITRKIVDKKVSEDYSKKIEQVNDKFDIIRVPCGPRRYMRKEVLWPYLDSFMDGAIHHFRMKKKLPNIIHAHYADAGYVGAAIAGLLELPFVFTGHSLGSEKQRRLMDGGMSLEEIQNRYNIKTRIEGEENALSVADMVVASTLQEVNEQYKKYENYDKKRMKVIPPGVDIAKFDRKFDDFSVVQDKLSPFLKDIKKPTILAISRADDKKNIKSLIEAYGKNKNLQEVANLVLILGNREDIEELDAGAKRVLQRTLRLIDKYNLYGKVAYPKTHEPDDIPLFYAYAKKTKGVFVNIAFTEPFGLTLIEAAASGVPIVATNDGGPKDIIKNCKHGVLVSPTNIDEIEAALEETLTNSRKWSNYSKKGLAGVKNYYTWESHVDTYLNEIERIVDTTTSVNISLKPMQKFSLMDKMLICDIDNTLLGDKQSLAQLIELIENKEFNMGFGIATGRHIESANEVLKEWGVPKPDLMITSVGSEIYYGKKGIRDRGWDDHIDKGWDKDKILEALYNIDGLVLQDKVNQRDHKVSYMVDPKAKVNLREIKRLLRKSNLAVNVIYSHGEFLDVLPFRASKGQAVRYTAFKWGINFSDI
ncbi:MAG: HAD-IIB family hydrolase, partial [Campylobacterales bacterium]